MIFKNFFSFLKRKNNKKTDSQNHTLAYMDIHTFVQESIIGIVSGIQDAQKEYLKENSAFAPLICPAWLSHSSYEGHSDKIHELKFDLAVTLTETSSSTVQGKVGITVVGPRYRWHWLLC